MKDLNNYILEKLKINKDTQVKYKPKVGDNVLFVNTLGDKYCTFTIRKINEVTEDGDIIIISNGRGYPDVKYTFKQVDQMENQEFAVLDGKRSQGILMDKDRAYKYLKDLYASRKGVIKYYFDGVPFRVQNPYEKTPMYVHISDLINSLID